MNRVQTADAPGAEAGRQPGSLLLGEESVAAEPTKPRRLFWSVVAGMIQGILALAVLAGGATVAIRLVQTKPKAKRKPPPRRAKLVEVETVRATREPVKVHAMGTVTAARRVDLQARVAGEIVWLSPDCIPGGRFAKDAEIAKIDRADYDLAVEHQTTEAARLAAMVEKQKAEVAQRQSEILQRASAVIQSEAALRIERGQQSVALREYELLGRTVTEDDRDLVLRAPQLRSAEATCKAAEAAKLAAEAMKRSAEADAKAAVALQEAGVVALRKAELDRDRTTIKAPFSALVESRTINEGSQVTTAKPFATLVGTDHYWVELSIPVDQLQWLRIPRKKGDPASTVRICDEAAWGKDPRGASAESRTGTPRPADTPHRTGTVLRLASALEAEGRMARLLVAVPDPLALLEENHGKPALLLGSYVRVEIDGVGLDNVVALQRDRLHDGDHVWVMDANRKLDIRKVAIEFRGRDRVLITDGLKTGERLVVTDLAAPVQGMLLRTREDDGPAAARQGGKRTPADAAEEGRHE